MKIKQAIDIVLKDIRENGISDEHRHAELHWGCAECQMRMLEGGLEWYKDIVDDVEEEDDDNFDN